MDEQHERAVQAAAAVEDAQVAVEAEMIASDQALDDEMGDSQAQLGPEALEPEQHPPVVDQAIEELLSAEGEPALNGSQAPEVKRPTVMQDNIFNGESSLDELLDTFADEELAAEAFAEALSYGGLPPVTTTPPKAGEAPRAPEPAVAEAADVPMPVLEPERRATAMSPLADDSPAMPPASVATAAVTPAMEAPVGGASTPDAEPVAAPPQPAESPIRRRRAARRAAAQTVAAAQPTTSSVPASTPPKARRGGFWRGLGLVLLGGLLGVALTLVGLLTWSGTLSYASRVQVEALSRNMGTMQSNQELTWQRVEGLTAQTAEQERRVAAAEQALAQSQQELSAVREQATNAEARVETLSEQLGGMQAQLTAALAQADTRMATIEGQATKLDAGLMELEEKVSPMQAAVQRFDGFLTSMRDLLIKLQGE